MIATPGQVLEAVLAHEPDDLAPALLATAVGLWDRPEIAETFREMVFAAATGGAAERVVREYLGHELRGRLEQTIGGRDAPQRTSAVAALMAGLFMTRYVLRIEPIASMARREVVAALSPPLRAALGQAGGRPTGRAVEPGGARATGRARQPGRAAGEARARGRVDGPGEPV